MKTRNPKEKVMFRQKITLGIVFLVSTMTATAQEADCSNFPRASNGKFEMTPQGPKMVAISEVAVRFDDVDVLQASREEAEMLAKEKIVKFLEEELSSESKIKSAVQKTVSIGGSDSAKASFDKLTQTAKVLHSKAKAVLRGVVVLDECYTPGKFVRVAVGLKPETIAGAGAMAGAIDDSLNKNPTRKTGSPDGQAQRGGSSTAAAVDTRKSEPLVRPSGYGGSGAIDKF